MADNELTVKFGAQIDGLLASVDEAKAAIEGFTAPITQLTESFGTMGEALAGAFAAEKLGEFISSMGELGEQTERLSQILGITPEQVGQLGFAAQMTGTETGNLAMVMGRFEASLADAEKGTGRVAEGLKALGLSAKELIGLNFDQQMNKIADATASFADGTAKTAALGALGRGFVQLIPLLDQGSQGMQRLREQADATNSVLDEAATGALANMEHGLVNLSASLKGDAIEAFQPFIGVINGAVAVMTDLAQAFSNSVKSGGDWAQILGAVAAALKGVEAAVIVAIQTISDLAIAGGAAANALNTYFIGLGQVIRDVFQALAAGIDGFFSGLVAAGAAATNAVARQFQDMGSVIAAAMHGNVDGARQAMGLMGVDAQITGSAISGAFNRAMGSFDFSKAEADSKASNARVVGIFSDATNQIIAKGKVAEAEIAKVYGLGATPTGGTTSTTPVPNMQAAGGRGKGAGGQALKDAEAEAEAEVDAYKNAAKQKEAVLNEELKTHQISMSQWLTATVDALNDEEQDVKAAYDHELSTAGLTSSQIIAIKRKEADAIAAIELQITNANSKAAEQSMQQWQSAANTIEQSWNSQLHGLISGTTSWSTAMKNIMTDLIVDVIEYIEKMATQWLISTALMKSASAGLGGIGGFFSGLFSGGGAALGALAVADSGAWSVPHDMVMGVHAGEMIVPQRGGLADGFRQLAANGGIGAGGGGPSVSIHPAVNIGVTAMDGASVARVLNDNPRELMRAVEHAVRHGAALGLRRLR